ncbi:MAG: hypothetical protein QOE44_2274, partial [Solirubrobacteraceae bacterium]|nr:hypothetical protein [Solirubrobacteraceae bacterium]
YLLTRGLFSVGFEWGRLARLVVVLGGVAVAGELALPASGAVGLASRAGALGLVVPLLVVSGFLGAREIAVVRGLVARARRRGG